LTITFRIKSLFEYFIFLKVKYLRREVQLLNPHKNIENDINFFNPVDELKLYHIIDNDDDNKVLNVSHFEKSHFVKLYII